MSAAKAALVVAACALLAGAITPPLAGAAGRRTPSAFAQGVYRTDLSYYRSVAAITEATVRADLNAVEAKQACASELPSDLSGQGQQVVAPLSQEFGFAFSTGALHTYFALESAETARIAALSARSPIDRAYRSTAAKQHDRIAFAATVDACGDLQSWKSASFAPAGEPANTAKVATLVASQNPGAGLVAAPVVLIPHGEYVRLKAAKARAQQRDTQIAAEVLAELKKFFSAAGIPVS